MYWIGWLYQLIVGPQHVLIAFSQESAQVGALLATADGAMFRLLSLADQVQILLNVPEYIHQHLMHLMQLIPYLEMPSLV